MRTRFVWKMCEALSFLETIFWKVYQRNENNSNVLSVFTKTNTFIFILKCKHKQQLSIG